MAEKQFVVVITWAGGKVEKTRTMDQKAADRYAKEMRDLKAVKSAVVKPV